MNISEKKTIEQKQPRKINHQLLDAYLINTKKVLTQIVSNQNKILKADHSQSLTTNIHQLSQTVMKNYFLFLTLLLCNLPNSLTLFCKPQCSSESACTSTVNNCGSCTSPFYGPPDCSVNTTFQVLFDSSLQSNTTFVPSGFVSTSPLARTSCLGSDLLTYNFLGPFVANNYVYKGFAGLGTNHYQVSVLWSFGIFGGWSGEQLSAIFTDGNGVVTQMANQGQNCIGITVITMSGCSAPSTSSCFRNKNINIVHNTDFLSVNFSSMGSAISTSTTLKSWGIKDLLIVVSKCDASCLTCFGSLATNCMSCKSGLYLQGSICILNCPFYTMPATGTCITSCPAYYYINTYNNFCEPCPINCPTCLNSTTCVDWSEGNDLKNVGRDYLAVWIILGILGLILISILLWKYCFSKKTFYDAMQEEVIDQKRVEPRPSRVMNQSTEKMEARWVEDIDELHLPKTHAKRARNPGQIQGIGIQLANLE